MSPVINTPDAIDEMKAAIINFQTACTEAAETLTANAQTVADEWQDQKIAEFLNIINSTNRNITAVASNIAQLQGPLSQFKVSLEQYIRIHFPN